MLYPLKFHPLLKEAPWGGTRLLAKGATGDGRGRVGESWEISTVGERVSVVANGPLAGRDLRALVEEHGADLLGRKVRERSGDGFPLLVKYIDARDDLSLQVHPGDETARQRHASPGKTEMWYVVEADPGASLVLGLERPSSREEFARLLEERRLDEILHVEEARAGDCFFVPAGLLHAIGKGCFIVEIQQASDVTYRVDDHDRPGADGKPRELHRELAADVIDYGTRPARVARHAPVANRPARLVACPYFTTSLLALDACIERDYTALDSFVIHACVEGTCTVVAAGCAPVTVTAGETVLLPAALRRVALQPGGNARLLEILVE